MNEDYDVIILGTGLKECILSGLLSVNKKKVLHLDRNDYYGGTSASLNLNQLFKKFENNNSEQKQNDNNNNNNNDSNNDLKIDEKLLGKSKDYSVDLCPKFLMGCGDLVKMLLHTKVTRYLEFRCVGGSFVFKDGKLFEVPMTPQAALSSSLMGMFQKRRYKNFLQFCLDVKRDDPKTWANLDLKKLTMKQVYEYWKCDENTQSFTGHAVALYPNDNYLNDPNLTLDCIERIQMYAWSLSRFEKSPYIYPLWGLGGLPEGFSRLCAVHGGVYMLRREIEEILYDKDGKVTGVKVKGEGSATCKQLIGDPSYFGNDKVKKVGQAARWLCILDHPVEGTNNAHSAQIIIPTKQSGHKADIYISVMSNELKVTPKNRWVAMISSDVFTNKPKQELLVAFKLLGKVIKDFFYTTDVFQPINQNMNDNVFIPSSMDSTTHFQAATKEVMRIYKGITGVEVDLNAKIDQLNDPE